MRLDWLEDILAVIETGSFSSAAERRCVTQPAFSRRIRVIEEHIGTELFDRDRKPVVLRPHAIAHQDEFRRLVSDMKNLLSELRRQGRQAHDRILIASQHSIAATLAPELVAALLRSFAISVKLRSANRDECLALLMTKQADFLVHYQNSEEVAMEPGPFVERAILGNELLLPVVAASQAEEVRTSLATGELPAVVYPSDSFLGQVFKDELRGHLPTDLFVLERVETALTIAALEFASKGIGVAWVPENLARPRLRSGQLALLDDVLPKASLAIAALRLVGQSDDVTDRIWSEIFTYARPVRATEI